MDSETNCTNQQAPEIPHQSCTSLPLVSEQCSGFKLVGDNIDRNVRPSLQMLTHQTRSLHHFHSYAVKDRVHWSAASDVSQSQQLKSSSFKLSQSDWDKFKDD